MITVDSLTKTCATPRDSIGTWVGMEGASWAAGVVRAGRSAPATMMCQYTQRHTIASWPRSPRRSPSIKRRPGCGGHPPQRSSMQLVANEQR
jgi:hypothetical protein